MSVGTESKRTQIDLDETGFGKIEFAFREIEKNGTGIDWRELQRRVSRGLATEADAGPVENIGLMNVAHRIRNGQAGHGDAVQIALQVEMTGRDVAA